MVDLVWVKLNGSSYALIDDDKEIYEVVSAVRIDDSWNQSSNMFEYVYIIESSKRRFLSIESALHCAKDDFICNPPVVSH
jgi:ribosome biogenesis protein Tsr3